MNNLFVISGPSGVGKTTLVDMLIKENPGKIVRPITNTTRAPRPGEINGVHYLFRTRDEFNEMLKAGELLESAEVYGNLYGTSDSSLARVPADRRAALIVDIAGAMNVRRLYPACTTIYITAQHEHLVERLGKRDKESPDEIELRLSASAGEQQRAREDGFDIIIENEDLQVAYNLLLNAVMRDEGHHEHHQDIQTKGFGDIHDPY